MFPLPLPWSGPFTSNICLLMEPATQLDRRGCPKSLLEICVHCPAQAWVSLSIGKLPTHPLGPVVHMVCLCSGTCQAPPPAKGTVSCLGGRGRGHFPRKPTHGVRRVGGATLIERCSADGRSLGLEPFRVPAKERINSEAGSLSGVLNPPAGGWCEWRHWCWRKLGGQGPQPVVSGSVLNWGGRFPHCRLEPPGWTRRKRSDYSCEPATTSLILSPVIFLGQ